MQGKEQPSNRPPGLTHPSFVYTCSKSYTNRQYIDKIYSMYLEVDTKESLLNIDLRLMRLKNTISS